MNILKPFYLLLFIIAIVSCSSDNNEIIEKKEKKEEQVEETEEQKINTNILSIYYPHDTGAYHKEKNIFEYNDSNQIDKISFSGMVYEINYINNNLIELNLLQENASNRIISKINKSIHLINNVVQSIVTTTVITTSYTEYRKDSTSYIYNNNYPSKIEYYSKSSSTNPIPNDYKFVKKKEFTITNGNITKMVITEGQVIKESMYTYDNETHIDFGELSYEMPFSDTFEYIIIHDKLGNKNSNNIVSLTNSFKTPYINHEFNTINYNRIVDSNNRLIEISISGSTILTHPSYPSITNFKDKKGIFTY